MLSIARRGYDLLFALYFGAVVLFLMLPILIVIPISFNDDQWLHFPPQNLSLRWYRSFFEDPRFLGATLTSFWIAAVVAVMSAILGTITALGLTRTRFKGKAAVYGLVIAPAIIPVIIVALAFFIFFHSIGLTGSVWGLVIAHIMLALPFPVLIVSAALDQFDETLERAGRVLGAGPFQVFRHITLPHITPAIASSSIFAFFISFDELAIALFITGRWDTLPKRIWSDLRLEIDPTIAAVAALLVGITLVGVTFGELLRRRAMRRLAADATE